MAVNRDWFSCRAAHVPQAASPVFPTVAVERLTPPAGAGKADPVLIAGDGSKVGDDNDDRYCRPVAAHEAHDSVVGVVGVDPRESTGIHVQLVQGGVGSVQAV